MKIFGVQEVLLLPKKKERHTVKSFFCCFSQEPQIANVPHCKHRTEPRLKFSYIIELAKYIGFDIPNEFVVGFGLDYAEKYRNLREVGVLAPHVYGG